jgi:hypothetical protein
MHVDSGAYTCQMVPCGRRRDLMATVADGSLGDWSRAGPRGLYVGPEAKQGEQNMKHSRRFLWMGHVAPNGSVYAREAGWILYPPSFFFFPLPPSVPPPAFQDAEMPLPRTDGDGAQPPPGRHAHTPRWLTLLACARSAGSCVAAHVARERNFTPIHVRCVRLRFRRGSLSRRGCCLPPRRPGSVGLLLQNEISTAALPPKRMFQSLAKSHISFFLEPSSRNTQRPA